MATSSVPARLERLKALPLEPNPALVQQARERAESVQNRIADGITDFAGSMRFVYLHVLWFGSWIIFRVEHYPYGLLTMIVSLEAIFLSTFVMISQNRADAKRQVVADQHWQVVKEEDRQNKSCSRSRIRSSSSRGQSMPTRRRMRKPIRRRPRTEALRAGR